MASGFFRAISKHKTPLLALHTLEITTFVPHRSLWESMSGRLPGLETLSLQEMLQNCEVTAAFPSSIRRLHVRFEDIQYSYFKICDSCPRLEKLSIDIVDTENPPRWSHERALTFGYSELTDLSLTTANGRMMYDMLARIVTPPGCQFCLFATSSCSGSTPIQLASIIPLSSDASKMFESAETFTFIAWSGDLDSCGAMISSESDPSISDSSAAFGNRIVRRCTEPPKVAALIEELVGFFSFPRLKALTISLSGNPQDNGQGGEDLALCDVEPHHWGTLFQSLPTITSLSISTQGGFPRRSHPYEGLEHGRSKEIRLPNLRTLKIHGQLSEAGITHLLNILQAREHAGVPRLELLQLSSDAGVSFQAGKSFKLQGDAYDHALVEECRSLVEALEL
jgi:hypothetical protein